MCFPAEHISRRNFRATLFRTGLVEAMKISISRERSVYGELAQRPGFSRATVADKIFWLGSTHTGRNNVIGEACNLKWKIDNYLALKCISSFRILQIKREDREECFKGCQNVYDNFYTEVLKTDFTLYILDIWICKILKHCYIKDW